MTGEPGLRAGLSRAIATPLLGPLQLVFRSGCMLCGEAVSGAAICPDCASTFQRLGAACCARCGKPKFEPSAVEGAGSFVCGECRGKKQHFDRAVSTFLYEGRMREAILTFKYRKRFRLGQTLGRLLARYVPLRLESHPSANDGIKPDVVIPVPLHVSRLREREFNQSAILARHVATALGLPVQYGALERIKATEFQSTLSPRRRIENVKNAFKVTHRKAVSGAHVLLVDDIFTHGATANECAKVLKKAGAESVIVVTLATPPLGHSVDDSDELGRLESQPQTGEPAS